MSDEKFAPAHKEVEETVPAASSVVTPAPEILPPAFQNTQEMSSQEMKL